MFVRFRSTKTTLQASLVLNRRIDGRVRPIHIAMLGSVAVPLTVEGREAFWRQLHDRLARLGNRLSAADHSRIMADIFKRVPLPTPDERRSHQVEVAEAEQRVWTKLHGLLAERGRGMQRLAEQAAAEAATDLTDADEAARHAAAAAERLAALRRGEAVDDGGRMPDLAQVRRRLFGAKRGAA